MRNTFINHYRKSQRVRVTRGEAVGLNVPDNHTFSRPDASAEYHDVWSNVTDIRQEYLQPFRLHLSGYKYTEIAQQLNLPTGTVKNRIFHARKEIQKKLSR